MVKVYFDGGHGGYDAGASANGLKEKDLTLELSLRARDILLTEYSGVEVRVSRDTDVYPSLQARTDAANAWGADAFVSFHINSGGGTGFETFRYNGTSGDTLRLQNCLHDEIMKVVGLRDRGKKQGNFHVIRESHMPAILTESGFIDHAVDSAKMKDANWKEAVARAHAVGVAKYFNLAKKTTAATTSPTNEYVAYKVIVPNTAYWQAAYLVHKYLDRGYKCYADKDILQVHLAPKDSDHRPFVIETTHGEAVAIVKELHEMGYDRAFGQQM